MGIKEQLKKLKRSLPPGGRAFFLFEGEQVCETHIEHPGDLVFQYFRWWRPDGESLPKQVEVIPGYVRPQNWRELEAGEAKEPGRIEIP